MKSMTGFGRSEVETNKGRVVVEIRSENHRFLDIRLQTPNHNREIENAASELIKKYISRGKIWLNIAFEQPESKHLILDKNYAKRCYEELIKLKKELNIKEDVNINHILAFRDIFSNNKQELSFTKSAIQKIKSAIRKAVIDLDRCRKNEGEKLKKDLKKRISRCREYLKKIKEKRADFTSENLKKLKERITSLLGNHEHEIDDARLYQEIAILSERSDITEELVRLQAHIDKFEESLSKKMPVGKELDFLILEMNREASTISAKAKDANISHEIIALRSELEKIREQIQNIE